ncbi:MAG: N-6 DNA methylase [Clostridia bacterium]|nr:N-6 DNA methylase [Clostridia bacterium]
MEDFEKKYVACYLACEEFLAQAADVPVKTVRAFVEALLYRDTLKEFYKTLCDRAVGCEAPTVISGAEEFFHRIDHYDEMMSNMERQKTGSYYTPTSIVKEMVAGVVETDSIRLKIHNRTGFKILEPSCGTMIFIRHFLERIYDETQDDAYLKELISETVTIDIQEEPLVLGVLGLLYKCLELTGDWRVSWQVRCEDALCLKGFDATVDLVIGNPPYLGEKGNRDFFRTLKEQVETAPYYEARMDLYYFFIHKGLNVLKKGGLLTFITTNYFITADSGKKLRAHIREAAVFRRLVDYSGDGLFKSARGQHNVSFVLERGHGSEEDLCTVLVKGMTKDETLKELTVNQIHEYKLYDRKGMIGLNGDDATYRLLEKIHERSTGCLLDCFDVKQGIVSGADSVTNQMLAQGLVESVGDIDKGTPIYVFPKNRALPFEGPWRPFYKNSDIGPYRMAKEAAYWIYYISNETMPSEAGIAYLAHFRGVLSKRREVKLGYRNWYELQWPRTTGLFEQPKLVMPQRHKRNTFAYSEAAIYGSADIYYIIHNTQDKLSLKYLNGVLNSKLYYYWLYHRGKKKGELLELYSTPIKNLPLIHYEGLPWQKAIIQCVDALLSVEISDDVTLDDLIRKIDLNVFEGFSLTNDEMELVENFYVKMLESKEFRR